MNERSIQQGVTTYLKEVITGKGKAVTVVDAVPWFFDGEVKTEIWQRTRDMLQIMGIKFFSCPVEQKLQTVPSWAEQA